MGAARAVTVVASVLLLAGSGCAGEDSACVEVDLSCTPLYEPSFDTMFERTLVPSCGVAGGACHSAEGARGGLVFANADEAYRLLSERVIPYDASCGELPRRLTSSSPAVVMPPGRPLPAAERCAILQWIDQGALR